MRNGIYIIEEAEIEMHRAEEDLEYARSETHRAHKEMEFAITENKNLWDQYKDMRNQYKDVIVEAREGGYFDEDAQAIKEDAQAIKEDAQAIKEEALEQNKVVQETEAVFNAVKIREKTAQEVYEAKKRCYEQIVAIFNTEKE